MKMTEIDFPGAQPPIEGYAPGGFRIAGRFLDGAALLTPGGAMSWGVSGGVEALVPDAAAPLQALKGEIDILLIGLGADFVTVPADFRAAMAPIDADPAGFGVEYMATPAACRTYNVLLSEQRRVAAALLTIAAAPPAER